MILGLSGIFYCVWIISVGCVCSGAKSDGAGFVEKSAKEGELDYPEGTWREKAQNAKIGDSNLFDTHVEGKECGARVTWKEERMMKKCTKQWNEGSGEIGKVQQWSFCDEWKMWGKGGVCGGSGVEGSVVGVNSSLKLNSLGLREMGGESVLRASDGSFVEVSGCVIGVERKTSPFDFCESCGSFTNISLRSSSTSTSTEQIFPSLFSSKATEGEISEKRHVSVCSSRFSSFCVSSAPFISSHFTSLSQLEFFNISTNPLKSTHLREGLDQRMFLMSGCSFSSVCDAYDGGIVPSLNNPLASLTASNTSFVGCCRTKNVKCEGTSDVKLNPGRRNETENGANSFTWCEWNGSKTTGKENSYSDGISSGGAICMYNLNSGELSVSHCSFNDCTAYYHGGAIMCHGIKSIEIVGNVFNSCTAQTYGGGGVYACDISLCALVSRCEFQNCKAHHDGGGLRLDNFDMSESECLEIENVERENGYVFDCSFTSCSVTSNFGGGLYCRYVPVAFKMMNIQFISCSALSTGGGFWFHFDKTNAPDNGIYCYFLFFHGCKCSYSTPSGHDVMYHDQYSVFLTSKNPFYECYTTNTDDKRVCYAYNFSNPGAWTFDQTMKKDWVKRGILNRFVTVSGGREDNLCGLDESSACSAIGIAACQSATQTLLVVTLMKGNHRNEEATIEINSKKIRIWGKGREVCVIGTKSLTSSSATLFSVTNGQLEVGHVGIDHNAIRSPSPSVFVASVGSGTLLLEDVLINSSISEESEISASVFVVALNQLMMSDVEIKNIKLSQPLFVEPSSAGLTQGEAALANVTVRNVNRKVGDGVVMVKSVKAGETFVVWNTTMEGCECENGNGGGIKVELASSTSTARIGNSISYSGGTTSFNQCKCSGYGGGMMLYLTDDSFDFEITSVSFDSCAATMGGKNVFVEAQDLSAVINSTSVGFNPEIGIKVADLNELCGRERNQGELIVPLVLFLRTFSSPVYVSGEEQGSEFRLCGYEDYPCRTIEEASEYRYPNSKRVIRLANTFSFDEEVQLNKQSYEIDSSNKNIGLRVEATGTKTQEALVMNSVSSTLTGILFEFGESIGGRSSFVHSSGGTLKFDDCGIKMGSGLETVNYLFVSASGGNVEIIGMKCGGSVGEVRFVGSMIVVNGSGECLMDEVIMNLITSNGAKGLIEIATSSSATIKNSSISNSILQSCGVIQIEKCSSITLKNTSFENISRGAGDGGCVHVDSNEDRSRNTMRIENCTFLVCEVSENGKGGGGLSVSLENPSELYVSSTRFEKCTAPSTSGSEGKGGGIFLSLADAEAKFELSGNLIFDQNKAEFGKNMFISTTDLNESVTNDSFNFNYSSMISDKTLFVGSDDFHSKKDLFMFLIPFSSTEIFISSSGFDVARCGSEEEPCETMWKGMGNVKDGDEKKTIQISGSTVIRDSFNMNNYQIKKDEKMGEENVKSILNFEKAVKNQLEYFMENYNHLELTNIQLQLVSGFDNSAKTIISNKNGELAITGCSFHSEAGMNNGFDCVFVDAIGGSVEFNDLSIESCNVGNSIFVIHDAGVSVHLVNVRVDSLNESKGCVLSIKKSELGLKINEGGDEGINIEIEKSSFSGVKRNDNGASILESKSEKKICLIVNSSNITEGKAEESEKGGAIFFTLGTSGSMKVIDSTISHCSCTNGKGGGVYLATKERGELNFSFVGMKFRNNEARVGNDIFVECFNITSQINETQFQFDLHEEHFNLNKAIYGRDECDHTNDTNLIDFVTIHHSDTIIVSIVNGANDKQCGTNALPCYSIDHGLMHLTSEYVSQIFIVEESVIGREINLEEMSLSSKSRENCKVEVKSSIEKTKDSLISTRETVSLLRANFLFDSNFISSHESLISSDGGILEIMNCSFSSKQSNKEGNIAFAGIPFHIINMEKGELQLMECKVKYLILRESVLYLSSQLPSVIDSLTIYNSTIKTSLIDIIECGQLAIKDFKTENISAEGNGESLISCLTMKKTMQLTNCTIGGVGSQTTKEKLMKLEDCLDVKMDSCIFDANSYKKNEKNSNTEEEEMCSWSGSLVDVVKSSVMMKDTAISNSPEGGITMSGGNVIIEKGEFLNNNPSIEGYPSLRRNIICSNSGILNVVSLKGGDGWERNTSLWMLNDGCSFEGIASERDSSFFIPVLESVEAKEETDRMKLTFKGLLLVPCNLSLSVVKRKGEEKEIEKHDFDSNGFLSEREIEGRGAKDLISSCGDEMEVSVNILFGNKESPSSTNSFILKNKSEHQVNGDERIVEGGNKEKSYWLLIVIIMAIVLFIVLIVSIIVTIRWRKTKNENKDLKEIVNDNIKKDLKAFEMVTMEMSPEEQWRRAEREAEKKNEDKIKKRVYEKSLGHSESSEHLLSESGSTEYILGRDSDKIPEWALEKVEEEEETRKRTPSPSISSTSTTDTSDTDTTFVRGEDLCPTTSSMSNLVDAMACSVPHEKLIVDLRDSLFMLLHGRNAKKEMAIGTLEEREMTAAQILFWVANLALHSFDEMENPLSSLANLSPLIVLFSEHMVICVAMHSDCSSDSDSSSISSNSTIITSSSDGSYVNKNSRDSLPSSAFEDEEDNRTECMRWKAPELMNGTKKQATKKTVVFSIGMMLWECLTLDIPFGEYEAVIAGEKIKNGERPFIEKVEQTSYFGCIRSCFEGKGCLRPTLIDLKREFIRHFPADAVKLTASDAIDFDYSARFCGESKSESVESEGSCSTSFL
ncbi:uncharacterized protein MONOS_177 [Monocercomonoides exilis]|uniref:uncharacterized protein n=1 Tax=Monocercomonoides exilis TaxID=2049356 RepID=UPI0035594401|nr:hypothetical protein MONOS_177 [Monocercomonoides exilis]|eukprot:MONOS_177.1-p1 / transcript=MONOS_177.1 / gene=MONOS_177 / organism=Monocercomonoides_exilis_PA203 / gene_product=unspecified product / transcript_product=unspecified product / location=Mono_scaffold00003:127482-135641(+) / protein_length=2719 / sequence_SO=supercontig / SO=protein_coding / is_pseudo=false